MAVRIRLTRVGATKQPSYRVVVADSRSARDSRSIETLGHYNPRTDPIELNIDADKTKAWIAKGALPSDTVARLLRSAGVLPRDPALEAKNAARAKAASDAKAAKAKAAAAEKPAAEKPAATAPVVAAPPAEAEAPAAAETPAEAEAPAEAEEADAAAETTEETDTTASAETVEEAAK
jgi:small subunit ribosomal protein S16